jgi:hypothetical protein
VEPGRPSDVVAGSSAVVPGSSAAIPESSDPGNCVCGTTNDVDAAFCKRCGAKLATGTSA